MFGVLIVLAGVYVLFVALLSGVISIFSMTSAPPSGLEQIWQQSALIMFGFGFAVLMVVAIGTFMRKNWARLSMIFISAVGCAIGIFSMCTLLMPAGIQGPPAPASTTISIFYFIFFVVIPLYFYWLFKSKEARAWFRVSEQIKPDLYLGRPLPVALLSCYFGFSVVGLFPLLAKSFSPMVNSFVIGDTILPGPVSRTVSVLIIGAALFLACGLFQRKRWAWGMMVVWFGVMWVHSLLTYGLISEATIKTVMANMAALVPEKSGSLTPQIFKQGILSGMIVSSLLLGYVLISKKVFVAGGADEGGDEE